MSYNNWKEKNVVGEDAKYILEMEIKQDIICQYFKDLLTEKTPLIVVQKFEQIFIQYEQEQIPKNINEALETIVKVDDEDILLATLKRCCYILTFPLIKEKKYSEITNLIKIFPDLEPQNKSQTTFMRGGNIVRNKLKLWINNFIKSSDYQDLKLLTYFLDPKSFDHWSHRYLEYLFFAQYLNNDNSVEQRDVALLMLRRIRKQFKFDLAMYFTKSKFGDKNISNPTILNGNILRFIKLLALRKGNLSYKNLAHLFLQQTKDLTYLQFQLSFMKYLEFSLYDKKGLKLVNQKLVPKLQELYHGNNDKKLNDAFLLRTCNKSFDLLLIDKGKPSNLLILFMAGSNPYTMVILLLKIILISPNSRNHLDKKIADLMTFYRKFPESESKWFINFMEVFRITFAIYADDDIEYSMVKVKETSSQGNLPTDLDSYQFFLQYHKHKKN